MERVVQKLKRPVMLEQDVKWIKVAAYARVSSGKDAMLHSLSAQVSYYNEYIQKHPQWVFAGIFADEAVTGTKDSREGFQRMLAKCADGEIDMVITKSVARFARNTVDLLNTTRELKALGVDVYFEEEGLHTLSSDGEFVLTIIASHAQEQSLSVSRDCKWRIRKNFAEGIASHCEIYGYRVRHDEFSIVPEEAEVVRMIYQDYLGGMGRNAIMRKLNHMRIPTLSGKEWNESTIADMLSNEKYAGDVLLQKTFVPDHLTKINKVNRGELNKYYVRDHHPPIVDRSLFEKVQKEIASRRRGEMTGKGKRGKHLFDNLLFCGRCGKRYQHKITASGTKYAKPVWICGTFNRKGKHYCDSQQIPEDILVEVTGRVIGQRSFDQEMLKQKVEKIIVPCAFTLEFHLKSGETDTRTWQHRDREWSEEERQRSRERLCRHVLHKEVQP